MHADDAQRAGVRRGRRGEHARFHATRREVTVTVGIICARPLPPFPLPPYPTKREIVHVTPILLR